MIWIKLSNWGQFGTGKGLSVEKEIDYGLVFRACFDLRKMSTWFMHLDSLSYMQTTVVLFFAMVNY